MGNFPILTAVTFLPLAGALLIMLVQTATGKSGDDAERGRQSLMAGLIFSAATFLASLVMLVSFEVDAPGYQLVEEVSWFAGVQYKLGIDGMSLLLILLTTLLTPISLIASFGSVKERVTEYTIAFLVLETFMIGVFCALDMVLFYVFFEAGLIPMFIIIGVWGGAERIYASFKFFLYTLLGSLFMLAAIVFMYMQAGTSDITQLANYAFAPEVQTWLWLAFFASFAVKLPMWPVHTWLPDAHVQAPTAGSVILAGILLKMGGYGFLRFSLPMFPDASQFFQPMMFALSVIAIVYASLVAFRQTDMKKLIAYSSVAHMGFVTLGIFSFTEVGVQGAIFQMISHGLISGALFLIVGVVYDRTHTREIAAYGGLVNKMPVYAAIFMLFSMANVGLPGTSGFVGEILTMTGTFQASTWAAAGAALGVIFSAVYMLTLYRRTVFGEVTNPALETIQDVTLKELITLVPLLIGTVLLGIMPNIIFDVTRETSLRALQMITGG
ncbi:MAG: NADH-quinone oxidoreductase subunit M [Henriciella sp.]|jgi:NADH-quinone oxidoreductase subunit M|uniref:NADH-quinone oxidoreductase subunit M n=1 Tax=Henriciella sp. TaxID=1968823 RepID=UPI000C0FCD93|nr:NADH-quinone oxidoreductase subunit M [Henriciella sp.]MAN73330.1 NADH-quinone oxidoreductase subunit M [Henriciella sp.]MBF33408.1 NADH-quinone oxidoreductase subunit M [Hyphomonadaceae bacterium]MBK75595.1 NADH-quinone oxidoreductase subunit M [Henriciella sp.]PHR82161.1 MAG: NADH-quinone oxidoreductase subunit M [Henriciella sp.]|tara:strand:+ start:12610 stop:14100 length:1491 start_codon:yes stop_codon:yes gene_type:complete